MLLSKSRIIFLILAFFITLFISMYSITHYHQLEKMDGMAEEYFFLGWIFGKTGSFYDDEKILPVFRPPGYIFFIGAVLKLWGGIPDNNTELKSQREIKDKLQKAYNAVYITQALLLSLSAVIIFLWLSNILNVTHALALSLLFSTNPYMVILTGLLHYDILHTFLTILSSYVLSIYISNSSKPGLNLVLVGALWGVTTLVRPMTLILPVFVLVMVLIHLNFQWKAILKPFICFCIGMFLVIAPYTFKNYKLTNKIIPVNAQGNKMLWAATAKKMNRDPNHYKWWNIWYTDGMKIYKKVTKADEYKYNTYMLNVLELEDEFKRQARDNFLRQPEIYFHNFIQNALTFNLDINSVFIKCFQVIQNPNMKINKEWLAVGNPQNFHSASATIAFEVFINILTLFSLLGILSALKEKNRFLTVPALIYLCFCAAHSIVYIDLMYYYIKVPFLFIFSSFFIEKTRNYPINIPGLNLQLSAAFIFISILIVLNLGLLFSVILI